MSKSIVFLTFYLVLSLVLFGCSEEFPTSSNELKSEESHDEFIMPQLPKSVNFCGKDIKMDNFDIQERLDKELVVNTFYHSSTIQMLKRANRYFNEIEGILKNEGVPDDMKYLCLIESGLTQATSPSGAKGFWQFMPETAEQYGLIINNEVDERMHIDRSTRAACSYLKSAFRKFHDWTLVAASYNMGVAGLEGQLERQQVNTYYDLHLNNETSRYVFRILALKTIVENKKAYGFLLDEEELYSPIEVDRLLVEKPIPNLIDWAKEKGTTYRMVKLLNPWILGDKLTNYQFPCYIEIPKS